MLNYEMIQILLKKKKKNVNSIVFAKMRIFFLFKFCNLYFTLKMCFIATLISNIYQISIKVKQFDM